MCTVFGVSEQYRYTKQGVEIRAYLYLLRLQKLRDLKREVLQKMYLMYYVGEDGNRVYTFKVRNEVQSTFFDSVCHIPCCTVSGKMYRIILRPIA